MTYDETVTKLRELNEEAETAKASGDHTRWHTLMGTIHALQTHRRMFEDRHKPSRLGSGVYWCKP